MPDESCRKCGGNLIDIEKCPECNHTVRWECQACAKKTIERFHYFCIYNGSKNRNEPLPTQFGNLFALT